MIESSTQHQQEAEGRERFPAARVLGTCLLAVVVGLIAGSLGSSFHYCLEKAFALHSNLAAALDDSLPTAVLGAALLGAAMAATAFVLVRLYAPEAAGSGVQEDEGTLSGLRPMRSWRVIPITYLGGMLAIGSGLLLGREGPTVRLGGCVGRIIGEKSNASAQTMKMMGSTPLYELLMERTLAENDAPDADRDRL